MILVVGSTRAVGSEVVRRLRDAGAPVRALVRSREKGAAAEPAGAELAVGDAADAASLDAALAGVERVFLVLSATPDQVAHETDVVDAVVRAGSPPIVKLSAIGADPRSPVRFLAAHGEVEDVLSEAGVPHTLLRASDLMQNAFQWAPMFAQGTVYLPVAEARVASVDVRDLAAAAAAALTEDGHAGRAHELRGSKALTRREQVGVLAAAAGREVAIVPIGDAQARDAMLGMGMSRWLVDGIVELSGFYAAGGGRRDRDRRARSDRPRPPHLGAVRARARGSVRLVVVPPASTRAAMRPPITA